MVFRCVEHTWKTQMDLWRLKEHYAMLLLIMLQCFPLSCNASDQCCLLQWKMKPWLPTIPAFLIFKYFKYLFLNTTRGTMKNILKHRQPFPELQRKLVTNREENRYFLNLPSRICPKLTFSLLNSAKKKGKLSDTEDSWIAIRSHDSREKVMIRMWG